MKKLFIAAAVLLLAAGCSLQDYDGGTVLKKRFDAEHYETETNCITLMSGNTPLTTCYDDRFLVDDRWYVTLKKGKDSREFEVDEATFKNLKEGDTVRVKDEKDRGVKK